MEVRTGSFGIYPRHGKDGKVNGWQGRAELVLEGTDFSRITSSAAAIQSLSISQVSFRLSRERRAALAGQAQALAIENFKRTAAEISREFGFGTYALREVNVSADEGLPNRVRSMGLEARASQADAPVPVEAGRSTVVVTVSGSVQMK